MPRLARFDSKESFDVRKNKVSSVGPRLHKTDARKVYSGYDRVHNSGYYFTRLFAQYSLGV